MRMLSYGDIKLIGEELGHVIEQNITPQFEKIDRRLDKLENRVEGLENKVDRLDGRIIAVVNILQTKHVFNEGDKRQALA